MLKNSFLRSFYLEDSNNTNIITCRILKDSSICQLNYRQCDIQQNDSQQNDVMHNYTHQNGTQQNKTEQNDIYQNDNEHIYILPTDT
jgi:hypothetical protein